MTPPVVIGIAGGSGSGKTTVLNRIIGEFGPDPIAVLDHDAYYRDLSHLSPEKRARFNFDHPDALETELMTEHLDALIEGILVLAESSLEERMDIKIYVDAADDIRLMRRIRRDLQERDRSIEGILRQYERTVRPMHLEFVEPSKREADIIIPRGGHNQVAIQMVMSRIQELLRSVENGTLQA